jgi:hypothetical protein
VNRLAIDAEANALELARPLHNDRVALGAVAHVTRPEQIPREGGAGCGGERNDSAQNASFQIHVCASQDTRPRKTLNGGAKIIRRDF